MRKTLFGLGACSLVTVFQIHSHAVGQAQSPTEVNETKQAAGSHEQQPDDPGILIDIKPEGYPNSVNPHARGVVPVAILGSEVFDVVDIDVTSLAFGRDGAPPAHNLGDTFTYNDHLQDLNLDGYMDLVTHYRVRDTGIACGDSAAELSGLFVTQAPCIDFIPSNPLPGVGEVTARKGTDSHCNSMDIDLVVSRVNDLYGAAFDVIFPPALISFSQASAENSILASDGAPITALTGERQPGQLVVGISRLGALPGIDIVEGLLIRLSFDRVDDVGSAPLDFAETHLVDSNFPPANIPGVIWFGGVVIVEETTISSPFAGSDSIRTVGCREPRQPAIWMKDQDRLGDTRREGPLDIERR